MLNKEELAYFKNALEEMKVKIHSNLNSTSSEMNKLRDNKPKDEGDYASMEGGQRLGNTIMGRQLKNLKAITRSFKRMENGVYGICDLCEESINIERLKVKIFADYCISCRESIEQVGK